MIPRIGAVAILVLSCVWLSRSPDWEPAVAVVVAVFAYFATEASDRQIHIKRHARIEKEVGDLKKRIETIEVAYAKTQEVISILKKGHDEKQRDAEDRLKKALKGFGGI